MTTPLAESDVIGKVRSVLYVQDVVKNEDPKFHTVAVHEAASARWAVVEVEEDGAIVQKIARFTPGMMKQALKAAPKNFDDFEALPDVVHDATRVSDLEARVAELESQNSDLTSQLNTTNRKTQQIADALVTANDTKGWFSGDSWWKDTLRKFGAAI